MSGRRLLVTGAAGFIGSNFVRYIFEHHPADTVVVLDKLTYAGNPENLKGLEKNGSRYRFVQGDIADAGCVAGLLKDPFDFIVNFAAETHVDRSIVDPTAFLTTNVIGTQILLTQAVGAKSRPRFLQISTDEVYGSMADGQTADEESALKPNSPYAASKAGADLLVRSCKTTFGLNAVMTRSSNNYGPYQYPEKFIPLVITNALEDKPIPLYGDGLNVRDWIHVEDNCRGIDQVLELAQTGPADQAEAFNIGGGNELTNRYVLETILKILHKPTSLIQPVSDRPGHDRRYAISTEKLKRQTRKAGREWKPDYSFEKGLEKTIAWYQQHADWWKPLKSRNNLHWLSKT